MSAVPSLTLSQLHSRWQALTEMPFAWEDLEVFLMAVSQDLPSGALSKHIGQVMVAEAKDPKLPLQSLELENISRWPMTTRIDGIMPLQIPMARDVTFLAQSLLKDIEPLGFEMPPFDGLDRLEEEISLCLLAWFHQRSLKSSHGMHIELTAQCPQSANASSNDVALMGTLPNAGRITVFYSSLRAQACLGVPPTSLEHYAALKAERDPDGTLVLVEDRERPERPQRLRW